MKLFRFKIKNYFNKLLLGFSTLAILITGNFTLNYTIVSADTGLLVIDGISYIVDSFSKNPSGFVTEIIKNGIKFGANSWATSNMDSNSLWAKSVASGIITYSSLEAMKTSWELSDMIGDNYDSAKQWVLDGWNRAIDNTKNASLDIPGSWLIKQLLGAQANLADTFGTIADKVKYFANDVVDTTYRNYYSDYADTVSTVDRVYNSGNTLYYTPYVDDTKTFYNTYNNTYEIVENYDYDIYNNYYTYNTTIDNSYHVSNTYNNTYVYSVTGEYDYELYYKLPNGANSFNLTEDEIKGIRTDFTVSNYEINYLDNANLLSLYHFNGSLDTLTTDSFLTGGLATDGINFVDSFKGFDLSLLHVINNSPNVTTRIVNEWYRCSSSNSCGWFTSLNSSYTVLGQRSTTYFDSNLSILGNLFTFSNSSNIKNLRFMFYYDSIGDMAFTSNSSYSETISSTNTNALNSKAIPNTISNYIHINKGWNFFEFNYNGSSYDVYNDGIFVKSIPNLNNFYIAINNSCNYPYFLIDELYISSESNSEHGIKYLPYDNNYYYTLPNVDTDNKLLIQSIIPVNEFQFGGVRPINATTGDVYIYLENGIISSLQQFNGTDWISVDGAIYSKYLTKWVNAIGYSIYTGVWDYSDVSVNDVNDSNSFAKWLSGVLNNINNTILLGFNSIVSSFSDLFGHEEDGSISTDDDSTVDDIISDSEEDINPNEDLRDYMLELKDLAKDNEFDTFDDLVGDELSNVEDLANETMGIFDIFTDNGLTIMLIGGLILSIVRLVI